MSRPLFTMWPKRAHNLFRRDEISADIAWLLIVLVTEADHETREADFPNLAALRSALGWDRGRKATAQHVRNCLGRARALGEISFDVKQGQRGPLVIRIEKPDYFQRDTPSALEVTSNDENEEGWQEAEQANAFRAPELPTLDDAPEQTRPDTDVDVDVDQNRGPALVDQPSERTNSRAAELVALLPPECVEDNTLTVIARYVRHMVPADVDEAEASYRNAVANGEIRNEARYLVGTLKKRALKRGPV